MKASDFLPKNRAYCRHTAQKWVESTAGANYWICEYCGKRVSLSRKGYSQLAYGAIPQNTTSQNTPIVPEYPYPLSEK